MSHILWGAFAVFLLQKRRLILHAYRYIRKNVNNYCQYLVFGSSAQQRCARARRSPVMRSDAGADSFRVLAEASSAPALSSTPASSSAPASPSEPDSPSAPDSPVENALKWGENTVFQPKTARWHCAQKLCCCIGKYAKIFVP